MLNPLLLLCATLALAEPDDESGAGAEAPSTEEQTDVETTEEGAVALPAGPELPSALDDTSPVSLPGEDAGLGDLLGELQSDRTVWSSGTFVRPTVAMYFHGGRHPVALGAQIGRRWWQLTDKPHLAFEVRGHGEALLGRGKGSYDVGLHALGGPHVSVVGLHLGPAVGWSQWSLGRGDLLDPAVGVDAVANLTVDLRLVGLYAGVAPRWLVSGGRPAADANPLGLGDELLVRAGAALNLGGVRLGLGWTRTFTAIGPLDRAHLNLRLQVF